MFAKIFEQIFDSSIASEYAVRHIFMDLIVLADRDGIVDMTINAISRRTNVPEPLIAHAIERLMQPDGQSRSGEEDGRRLVLLDPHRDWGWQIVNYEPYRQMRDDDARRAYFRDKKREYRAKDKPVQVVLDSPTLSNDVNTGPTMSTQAEAEAEAEAISDANASSSPSPRKRVSAGQKKRQKRIKNKPPTKTDMANVRHKDFKAAIFQYWQSKNKVDCPWGPPEGMQLEIWLRDSPNVNLPEFKEMLRNRYRSPDVNHAERPSMWIRNITSYAAGPIDRYGKPVTTGGSNGRSRAQSKQAAIFANVEEGIARLRGMDHARTGEDRGPDGGGDQHRATLLDDERTD